MADYEAPIVAGRVQPSTRAQMLLVESHAVASRAWLLSDDGASRAPLPLIAGGAVSCDPGSAVRRSATISIYATWPEAATSPLTPYGTRVCVQHGIRVAVDAIEWMTIMTGPVWETAQSQEASGPGPMSFPLKDDMATVARDEFEVDTSTDTTLTVAAQIEALIRRTLPAAEFIDLSGELGAAPCGKLNMQKDPAAGMTKLAASVGCEVFCGRGFQQFVLRPVPSLDDPARWTLTLGGDQANIVTVARKRSREKVINRIVVKGETNDATPGGTSTPPPTGEARITDNADPLFYGGHAGRASKTITLPVKTNEQAAIAAAGWLEKVRGASLETSFTTLVNPALDGGDVITSTLADGIPRRHIADAVTFPLGHDSTQDVPTRGVELPSDTAGAA